MPPENNELIDKQNLEIERSDATEKSPGDLEIPQYKEQVDYSDETIERLKTEVFEHFDHLKSQRESEGLDSDWDSLDAQFDGQMEDTTGQEFNLDTAVTKIKVNSLVGLSAKAFNESEPRFEIELTPESIREGREQLAEMQTEYLDYVFDVDVKIQSPLRKALHQATNLDVGIIKEIYEYATKRRKREEHYSGETVEDPETGEKKQPGLLAFIQEYPNSQELGDANHVFYKQLKAGKEIDIVAEFDQVYYNNPKPFFVDCRDFYVDQDTEGYAGLCNSQFYCERLHKKWWNLKQMERSGDLINVDELKNSPADSNGKVEQVKDYRTRPYKVLECVYWFNEVKGSEDPDDEARIVCWFSEENKKYLGAIYYPYYEVDSYHIPFYIKDDKPGFYKGGLSRDLTDSHLAQNAILNFMLTGAWIENTITPIIREGSSIAEQFIEKRWTHGVPIEIPEEADSINSEIDFLKTSPMNTNELMNVLLFLGRIDDDQSRISSLKSGKETPLDPNAPASKVALLLRESGVAIEDYISILVPSFSLIGDITLKLINQMARGGRKFKQKRRAREVTGRLGNDETGKFDIFSTITPDQMRAKTVIKSRAAGFSFDKENEKRENLALYQVLRGEAAVVNNPEAIYQLVRTLIKSWGPEWKIKVDKVWPTPEEFQEGQLEAGVAALQVYMQQLAQQRETTGVDPEVNAQDFLALAQQLKVAQLTPPPPEKGK